MANQMGSMGGSNPGYSQMALPKQDRSWSGSKRDDVVGINNYTPEQQNVLNYLLQNGQGQLQNPYQGFEPIKQDAMSTFFQDIVPRLQEQFSASGSNSASSGTLKNELSGAGATLAERLAAFQAQFGQQNQQNAMQQLQLGLNPRSDFLHRQGGGGWLNSIKDMGVSTAPTIGKLLGQYWFS